MTEDIDAWENTNENICKQNKLLPLRSFFYSKEALLVANKLYHIYYSIF